MVGSGVLEGTISGEWDQNTILVPLAICEFQKGTKRVTMVFLFQFLQLASK